MANLFARKPLDKLIAESQEVGEHTLKRTLGPVSLVALGIGAIIGAGLFVRTAAAIADRAGPSVVLAFMVAGVGCAFAGLCYAEFASMIPIAVSAYTYSYATMGEFLAWIIGWDLILEYAVGAATVSIGWAQTLVAFLHHFGIHLPPSLSASPFQPITLPGGTVIYGIINLPAVFIVVVVSIILMIGIRESAGVNTIIVFLKVTVVVVFIAIGWAYMNPVNHEPLIPQNTGTLGEFGWSGILTGAGLIFFAYIGFDAVSTAAQETKMPKRD